MHFVKKHSLTLIILIGSLVWSVTMVKSGLMYKFGMGFWGANGHDGIWHVAVANTLFRGSLEMPVFAGNAIANYHLGFDLLLAFLHFLTRIPLTVLYFQILPPLISVSFGLTLYAFVRRWQGSVRAGLLALFFGYFGGSWGWLVNLFRSGSIGGESMFWSQQSISTLINPPFALSLVMMSSAMLFLHLYISGRKKSHFWAAAILFGLLALVKVYAGLLSLTGLLVVSVYDRLKNRSWGVLKLTAVSLLISAVVFFPGNRGSAGLIAFRPFWFLDSMLSVSDRVNWPRLFGALTAYRQTGNWFRLFLGYGLAMTIFVIGNLGTRVIGINRFKHIKKFGPLDYFLLTILAAGIVVPTFFVQSGTPWNTIQFFYYSLFAMNIFAALASIDLLRHIREHSLRPIFLAGLMILTLPTTLDSLKHYLPARPPAMITKEELEALRFLSTQPRGVVFEYPISPDQYAQAPRPLYLYESTAYVSAFSGQPSYLADTVNLNITGYNWPVRRDLSAKFVAEASESAAREFITQNNIRYIYLADVSEYRPVLSASQLGGEIIFENSQAAVWAVGPR